MNLTRTSEAPARAVARSGRRLALVSCVLVVASIAYALAAMLLPHRPTPSACAGTFIAGAVPGLLVTLLLWLARPGTVDRKLRRLLVGVTMSGAAAVALLPLLLPRF